MAVSTTRVGGRTIACPMARQYPAASLKFAYDAQPVKKGVEGSVAVLEFGAGVRVDFAIQANFFKCRRCPFHDFPQIIAPG